MSSPEEHRITTDILRVRSREAPQNLGMGGKIAKPVIDGLLWASLRGIDSHGIRLLPHYAEGVKGGRLNPRRNMRIDQTAAATGTLDANHTCGHAAGVEAVNRAIDLVHNIRIGPASRRNRSHCGALSCFAHLAAKLDLIGMVPTCATARVKTPGSNRAFFGNNPICLDAPTKDEELLGFDAATTAITINSVKAAAGQDLPPGLVADADADADGNETTNPSQAKQLLPIGGYKGFGLSMMVDVLCVVLSGMSNRNNVGKMLGDSMSRKRKLGHSLRALGIDAFRDVDEFKVDLKDMVDWVRIEPVTNPESRSELVPGDPEKQSWRKRFKAGIPVPESYWEPIMALGANKC